MRSIVRWTCWTTCWCGRRRRTSPSSATTSASTPSSCARWDAFLRPRQDVGCLSPTRANDMRARERLRPQARFGLCAATHARCLAQLALAQYNIIYIYYIIVVYNITVLLNSRVQTFGDVDVNMQSHSCMKNMVHRCKHASTKGCVRKRALELRTCGVTFSPGSCKQLRSCMRTCHHILA